MVLTPILTERPILFNTDMVKAILDGSKTQTRRVMKNQNEPETLKDFAHEWETSEMLARCPYGQPGDVLWVRETWAENKKLSSVGLEHFIYWKASHKNPLKIKWRPSIHMPKSACRLFLQITNVKIERLQDITEEDAIAEGVQAAEWPAKWWKIYHTEKGITGATSYAKESFESLWESIYGNLKDNPWVWVVEFVKIEKP